MQRYESKNKQSCLTLPFWKIRGFHVRTNYFMFTEVKSYTFRQKLKSLSNILNLTSNHPEHPKTAQQCF